MFALLRKYIRSLRRVSVRVNEYVRRTFGIKLYKIAIDGGFTCPNRDGTLGTRGCIFCSQSGSGDFASDRRLSVTEQIEQGKSLVAHKNPSGRYIAYFQAYTNTYGPIERLRSLFTEAIRHPDIEVLSIATRPDCLAEEVLDLLAELNRIKPVWVELGLQTIHEDTARYIRRGYPLSVYDKAVENLQKIGISQIITHVILGLPGETREQMLETVRYVRDLGMRGSAINQRISVKSTPEAETNEVSEKERVATEDTEGAVIQKDAVRASSCGIKLQLLHVLKNTDLAEEYEAGALAVMDMETYVDLVAECIALLPEEIVIHRMTGDGSRKDLIAPLWSLDKKRVLNALNKRIGGL